MNKLTTVLCLAAVSKQAKSTIFSLTLIGSIAVSSCRSLSPSNFKDDRRLNINYLLVNDVYEIAPLAGGTVGGMARVATLKKEYLNSNPNTFLVMAGDFLSPSIYNSLQYEGKRIRGKQMIAAMNESGMDFAIFGNHEFDIPEADLLDRINESDFRWIASNTFHKTDTIIVPFVKKTSSGELEFPKTVIQSVKDADGTVAKIGFIGLTLPFNKAGYVSYSDPLTTAVKLYGQLKDSCDAVIAITHQLMEDDILLAQKLPGLAMILGGHEHDMRFQKVGKVLIVKAHANAKSAYAMKLNLNTRRRKLKVKPELKMIDATVTADPATAAVVEKWTRIADQNYASLGFDPKKIVVKSGEPLEGRESLLRKQPTNMSRIVVKGMEYASPSADLAILNAGSIRIDDILPMPVTEYDILRALPFGGGITEVDMNGRLLIETLSAGLKNTGNGGYLHYSETLVYDQATDSWTLKGAPLMPEKTYRVALPDFLLTGGEANMDFLKSDNPDIAKSYPYASDPSDPRSDIRLAVVRYLYGRND